MRHASVTSWVRRSVTFAPADLFSCLLTVVDGMDVRLLRALHAKLRLSRMVWHSRELAGIGCARFFAFGPVTRANGFQFGPAETVRHPPRRHL